MLLPLFMLLAAVTAGAGTVLPGPFDNTARNHTLVPNGGFENTDTNGDLRQWTAYTAIMGQNTTYHFAGSASGGMRNANWTNGGAGTALAQAVAVSPNTNYTVSAYLYRNHPSNGGGSYIDLADQNYTQLDGGTGDCTVGTNVDWAQWVFLYCSFNTGSATSVTVRAVVDGNYNSGDIAVFDLVALTPTAQFSPPVSKDRDWDGHAIPSDCDDGDANIHPGVTEVCDGKDNDCDGTTDGPTAQGAQVYYADVDGDGFGDPNNTLTACVAPPNTTSNNQDCNDTRSDAHPGAPELWYDGIDQACDGGSDYDKDGDGHDKTPQGDDCNDDDAAIRPGVAEIWYDGTDQDCDGGSDYDKDGDGVDRIPEGLDCDDDDAAIKPGVAEVWYDGTDQNCDGADDFDQDGDGHQRTPEGGDCDDTNAAVKPGATEVCDSIDNDCNGDTDGVDAVDRNTYYRDSDRDGFGTSSGTLMICGPPPQSWANNTLDCDDQNAAVNPDATESCNAIDDDCDTFTDEDSGLFWYPDDDNDGDGDEDATPVEACNPPSDHVGNGDDCDDTDDTIFVGATEVCDGIDQDCDDQIDDGLPTSLWHLDFDNDGYGDAGFSVDACGPPSGYVADDTDCNDNQGDIYPTAPELCDSIDNDCNGVPDDGVVFVDWYADDDDDGFGDALDVVNDCAQPVGYADNPDDCDDQAAGVHPDATEVWYDGIDQDCDGNDDDQDEDGVDVDADCDDTDPRYQAECPEPDDGALPDTSVRTPPAPDPKEDPEGFVPTGCTCDGTGHAPLGWPVLALWFLRRRS